MRVIIFKILAQYYYFFLTANIFSLSKYISCAFYSLYRIINISKTYYIKLYICKNIDLIILL